MAKKKDKQIFEVLPNVEIFRAGVTNSGRLVTKKWLQEIIDDTEKAVADGHIPKATLGNHHFDGDLAGSIQNIRLQDNSIYADLNLLKNTFDKVSANKKAYDTRSIEVGGAFRLSNNTRLKNVITGLALGILRPEQHQLGSMFEASSDDRDIQVFEVLGFDINDDIEKKDKEKDMAENTNVLADKVASQAVTISDLTQKLEIANAKIKEFDGVKTFSVDEKKALEKERDEALELVKTFEVASDKALFDGFIESGKLLPVDRDEAVKTFEVLMAGFEAQEKGKGRELATEKMIKTFSVPTNMPSMEQKVENGKVAKVEYTADATDHSHEGGK